MNEETTVTLKTYATEVAAEADAACLEANGIHCMLTSDDCGGMLSAMDNYSGVKLTVAQADAEAARDLLNAPSVAPSDGDVGPSAGSVAP